MRPWTIIRLAVLLLLGVAALLCLPMPAQTVAPVVVEYRGGAVSGSFDLTNDGLAPLVVTIEPKSFAIDRSGQGEFRALDNGIHVLFSETSLRLLPKSRRTIYYRASAETYPAWFSVYSIFHGLPKRNNLNIQLELPHTVYLLGDYRKSKAQRGDLQFENLQVKDGKVTGSIRNVSSRVQRVTRLSSRQQGHGKLDEGGFPLLPGGTRDFEWKLADPGHSAKLEASFGGDAVTLEAEVEAGPAERERP